MSKISMRKISEILRQRYDLKLSYREIARSQHVSTSTVSEYLWRAKLAGINGRLPDGITEQELYNLLYLPVEQTVTKRTQPDWDMIHQLEFGQNSLGLSPPLFHHQTSD